MASTQADPVIDLLKNYDSIDTKRFMKLNMEQAARLISMFKLGLTREEIKTGAKELKARHEEVRWLHQLQGLVNKLTEETGDDVGKLILKHEGLKHDDHKFVVRLANLVSGQIKHNKTPMGERTKFLKPDENLKGALEAAAQLNPDITVKDQYQEDEISVLTKGIRTILAIESDDDFKKLQDIFNLREMLAEAVDKHGLEIEWPVDEYSPEAKGKMMHRIETLLKDLGLQNDMQMQETNRKNQESLEIIQMARSIVKTIHDDKVHKMRSAAGR